MGAQPVFAQIDKVYILLTRIQSKKFLNFLQFGLPVVPISLEEWNFSGKLFPPSWLVKANPSWPKRWYYKFDLFKWWKFQSPLLLLINQTHMSYSNKENTTKITAESQICFDPPSLRL
jgi:hypothetical protein